MNITELEKKYLKIINSGASLEEYLEFEKILISSDQELYLNLHYKAIGNRSKENLYKYIRASFKNRKDKTKVSEYLFKKYNEGIKDDVFRADVIQILGNLRSPFAKEIIYKEIKSAVRDIRYRCLIVMGWLGSSTDLTILNERMTSDVDGELRGFAATAMRQIWYNRKSTKNAITKLIKESIINENNNDALIGMIITIQELHKMKLGIKESKYGDISGDVSRAKEKTIKVLEKL